MPVLPQVQVLPARVLAPRQAPAQRLPVALPPVALPPVAQLPGGWQACQRQQGFPPPLWPVLAWPVPWPLG
ncbi:hypothetical protein [Halomonas sp.]|uniref:hypothetical protein n=1 Tax=Halomonas sp. TaxID=1486246 RepID=UPI00298ECA60|nr:hypothetical protein [Halomonas sp.]MDW7749072.1 hypothetical protein [Halomonas sp.]